MEALTIEDRTATLDGLIVGWTQYSRRFELLTLEQAVIQGEVAPQVMEAVTQEGRNPMH